MTKEVIIFFILLNILFSCSIKETKKSQIEEVELSATPLTIDKEYIARPEDIHCNDSLLFVWDSHSGQLYTLFNYQTGKCYGRFASIGNGPSEFAKGAIGYPSQDKYYVSNYITGHIAQYDIDSLCKDINYEPTTIFRHVFTDKVFLSSIIPINDSLYFGAGVYNLTTQYLLFNHQNQVINSNVPIYNLHEPLEKAHKLLSNQGYLTKSPISNKFAFALKNSQNIDFVEVIGNNINVIKLSRERNPNYTFIQRGNYRMIHPVQNSIIGYMDITSGNSNVYALYSEKKINETKRSNIIHVYNWDGIYIKKLKLSEEVYSISVNEKENILFATIIDSGGNWNIISYKLKK